jgi:hypothetical protein
VDTYLQGRKVTAVQDYRQPSVEALHLICKLRWMGMEAEAEQAEIKLREATPTGSVITAVHETD